MAVRYSAGIGDPNGQPNTDEPREMFSPIAELPDLWDINITDYSFEMGASRFVKEGSLEPYVNWVKPLPAKPVVGVGRFTTPDIMVHLIRQGVLHIHGERRRRKARPCGTRRRTPEGRVCMR